MKTAPSKMTELIVDAYECRGDLSNESLLMAAAKRSIDRVGATICKTSSASYQPHGVTVCLILNKSHLIISTWPEHQLAIVNIFFCDSKYDPKVVWKVLENVLNPKKCYFQKVKHHLEPKKSRKLPSWKWAKESMRGRTASESSSNKDH